MNKISYRVPLIPQGASQTCWYASAQMIVRWHRKSCRAIGEKRKVCSAIGTDLDTRKGTKVVNDANYGLSWAPQALDAMAKATGLKRAVSGGTLSPAGVRAMLGKGYRDVYSPGHCVVITGLMEDSQGKSFLEINDPWPIGVGDQLLSEFDEFLTQLPMLCVMHVDRELP